MNEVKSPKKPLIYYYSIVMLSIVLFNLLIVPMLSQHKVVEVDYGTFMSMTQDKDIGLVEIQSNQIVFTDKEQKSFFRTGRIEDAGLIDRLYASEAKFSSEIVEETSPLSGYAADVVFAYSCFRGHRPVHVKKNDEQGRRQLYDVQYGQQQSQGIYKVLRRNKL